jgi:hypothetical protein
VLQGGTTALKGRWPGKKENTGDNFVEKKNGKVCGWLGGPSIAKTMKIPQRHGAGFDPPIIFCACSTQNTPGGSGMPQEGFYTKLKARVFGAL